MPIQAIQRKSVRSRRVVIFGFVLACCALFVLELGGRTLHFWLYRSDYVRTEIEVTQFHPGEESDPTVWCVVVATGEVLRLERVPMDLYTSTSFNGLILTPVSPDEAIGKRIPIWFAQDHTTYFSSPRVQYVSEFDTLPSGARVLKIGTVGLSVFALGIWLMIRGNRQARQIA